MINNRQGGRRRGRGGQRPQGMPGSGGRDNRNRGNAAQLLEKYKGLARDAQLAGDRVQTEYYLQFADHYYRVLEEIRPQGEQQGRRRRDDEDEEFDGDFEPQPQPRAREPRESRERSENRDQREPRDSREDSDEERQPRRRRSRRDRDDSRAEDGGAEASDGERLPLSALPPAIGSDAGDEADAEDKPKRRRTRKPRAEEGDGPEADAA